MSNHHIAFHNLHSLQQCIKVFLCLYPHQHLLLCFDYRHSEKVKWCFIVVLIWIFLIACDIGIFSYVCLLNLYFFFRGLYILVIYFLTGWVIFPCSIFVLLPQSGFLSFVRSVDGRYFLPFYQMPFHTIFSLKCISFLVLYNTICLIIYFCCLCFGIVFQESNI